MQTFLPYADYKKCAEVLDYRRLGKQRVEAWMILQILAGERPESRWRFHPVVKMWRGFENSLVIYAVAMCNEWVMRDYEDNCRKKILDLYRKNTGKAHLSYSLAPPWITDKALFESHQSNLIRKKPEFYGPKFPGVPNNLSYIWPV